MPNTPDPQAAREAIRRALAEADGFAYENLEPHDYQRHADALLALLPAVVPSAAETTNRAASDAVREQLLAALDFAYCQTVGYDTPEALLAAYDATQPVPPPADRATLLREAADIAEALAAIRPQTLTALASHIDARSVAILRPSSQTYAEWQAMAALLRRMAAEEQPAETQIRETSNDCCGTEPPADGSWGDCWCTLPPGHDGEHQCQPCTDRHGAPGWTDRAVGEQPDTQTREADRTVAYTPTTRTELHCLRCTPNPAGDIWTPVTAEELDDGGICTVCGRDVLITVEADRG